MSAEANKALVRQWVEEGWVKKNLSAAGNFYASDYVLHLPGFPPLSICQPVFNGRPN